MRILLDENVPRPFRRHLVGHEVSTVRDMEWLGLKNGQLMEAMRAEGFELLITMDQNFRHQQHVAESGIAVMLVVARSNKIRDLEPLTPDVLKAIPFCMIGKVTIVPAEESE